MSNLMQEVHAVLAMPFIADSYTGGRSGQVISMKGCDHITFMIEEGAGGTGTATITVDACDDFVPTNPTAMAFRYKVMQTASGGDTWSTYTWATASGYATVAGANKQIAIDIDAAELETMANANGRAFPNIRLSFAAGTAGACVGGAVAILSRTRYKQDVPPTALS